VKKNEKDLKVKLENSIQGATPGLQLQAYHKGRKFIDIEVGKTWKYYDLASLTKVVFTNTFLMYHQVSPQEKLNLPWLSLCNIKLQKLLSHSAGFQAWNSYYKETAKQKNTVAKWEALKSLLQLEKSTSHKSIYSDIDYLLLAFWLERHFEKPLLELWLQMQNDLNLEGLHFNPQNQPQLKKSLYAPTEKCPWRKKTLQGEVHDDNTWALGGVSTHAGLFGSIDQLSQWSLLLRNAFYDERKSPLKHKIVKTYLTRAIPKTVGDWALGFMMPSIPNSSCGQYFDPSSIGHTGFTGTSFWFDPKRDLIVNILSNRVHPTRDNRDFVQLRPLIHNWIVEDFF